MDEVLGLLAATHIPSSFVTFAFTIDAMSFNGIKLSHPA